MRYFYRLAPAVGLVASLFFACSGEPPEKPAKVENAAEPPLDTPSRVSPRLTSSLAEALDRDDGDAGSLLGSLYSVRHHQPVWVTIEDDAYVLTEKGRSLVALLSDAPAQHALDDSFVAEVNLADTDAAVRTELAISRRYVELAHALGLPARLADASDDDEAEPYRLVDALQPAWERALSADQLESLIAPPYGQYRRLLDVYPTYREPALDGDFDMLPPSVAGLDAKALNTQFAAVAPRLESEGFWVNTAGDFGANVVASLKAFQRANRLAETGWLDDKTRKALNVTAKSKARRIARALEQWRQSPIGADDHYVWVNIPDYHAEVWQGGERKMRFRVIVGAGRKVWEPDLGKSIEQGQTPRFSDKIELIEFNPYWWIPDSIIENEYAPRQAQDPTFYKRNGFEWGKTGYGATRLRQRPGPNNALGQVKFLFPNDDAVYLHDTNKRELFDREDRNLSHGCVRIENPFDFARHLMTADGHSVDEVDEFIEMFRGKSKPSTVVLWKPVPIHIGYITARVDDDGHVRFLPDPYGLEKEISRLD